ncbi:MAG: hypothetical protein KDB00_16955 [Planctomycetales bacterium]|nr:hypothetical protein [Planctomycetales bacterium]
MTADRTASLEPIIDVQRAKQRDSVNPMSRQFTRGRDLGIVRQRAIETPAFLARQPIHRLQTESSNYSQHIGFRNRRDTLAQKRFRERA